MPRVVHFDIDSDDPERAIGFYSGVFGWKFEKWDGPMDYWLVTTGPDDEPGIDGGLAKRMEGGPLLNAYNNTIEVPDADEYAAKVRENGGQTLMDKMAIPGVGWYVPCVDTEGNNFGLMQSDESAA
jgi:predicted enzyme related to lactoylglutathione lyase